MLLILLITSSFISLNVDAISDFVNSSTQQPRLLSTAHNPVMKSLNELNIFIKNMHNYDNSTKLRMKYISDECRLHPAYLSKLPFWITVSWNRMWNSTDLFDITDYEQILEILNIHSIGMTDFLLPPISKLDQELKLLLLASRGLVQYLSPTFSEELELQNEPMVESVTWMSNGMDYTFVPFFCYLYKDLMYKLNISLNSIYDLPDNDLQKQLVLDLVEEHGLILWTEETIHWFISTYYQQNYDRNILKFIKHFKAYDDFFFGECGEHFKSNISLNDFASDFMVEMRCKYNVSIDNESKDTLNKHDDVVIWKDYVEQYVVHLWSYNLHQQKELKSAVFAAIYNWFNLKFQFN